MWAKVTCRIDSNLQQIQCLRTVIFHLSGKSANRTSGSLKTAFSAAPAVRRWVGAEPSGCDRRGSSADLGRRCLGRVSDGENGSCRENHDFSSAARVAGESDKWADRCLRHAVFIQLPGIKLGLGGRVIVSRSECPRKVMDFSTTGNKKLSILAATDELSTQSRSNSAIYVRMLMDFVARSRSSRPASACTVHSIQRLVVVSVACDQACDSD